MRAEAGLTQRETQIAELLAWGAAKKEVADRLSISPRTVENTARNILNTRLIDLTAGELLELIGKGQSPRIEVDVTKDPNKKYVYGRAGIAELFKCSKTTASRIKQSGLIDGAYRQVGRLIIVDAEKALELAAKRAKKSNNRNK